MSIDNDVLAIAGSIACTLLAGGLGVMGYFLQKRDDVIDKNTLEITNTSNALAAHKLRVAEDYATKSTVIALFQQVTQENKDAIYRVDKRIDEGNALMSKTGDKIDKVIESIGNLQTTVLLKLSEKSNTH